MEYIIVSILEFSPEVLNLVHFIDFQDFRPILFI